MTKITQQDIDRAKAKQMEVFRNPKLLLRAHEIAEAFFDENANGIALQKELRDLLINQGEWDFEQEIKDHPYGMEVPNLGKGTDDDERKDWLAAHLDPSDYILMPKNAMGKYKDHWNWIYFREKDQAMLFKLTWY